MLSASRNARLSAWILSQIDAVERAVLETCSWSMSPVLPVPVMDGPFTVSSSTVMAPPDPRPCRRPMPRAPHRGIGYSPRGCPGIVAVMIDAALAAFLDQHVTSDEHVATGALDAGLRDDVEDHTAERRAHVARWRPERVLAECAAKRRLIRLAIQLSATAATADDAETALRVMASAYRGREGWRSEWNTP